MSNEASGHVWEQELAVMAAMHGEAGATAGLDEHDTTTPTLQENVADFAGAPTARRRHETSDAYRD